MYEQINCVRWSATVSKDLFLHGSNFRLPFQVQSLLNELQINGFFLLNNEYFQELGTRSYFVVSKTSIYLMHFFSNECYTICTFIKFVGLFFF